MKKHMHTSVESAVVISVISLVLVALGSILILNGNWNITHDAPSAVLAPSLAKTQVTVLSSVGGTTDPTAGNYAYQAESLITLNATAEERFVFDAWIITSTANSGNSQGTQNRSATNPITVQCRAGYEYVFQAVFKPTTNKAPESYLWLR
jgi:hypothetical protein